MAGVLRSLTCLLIACVLGGATTFAQDDDRGVGRQAQERRFALVPICRKALEPVRQFIVCCCADEMRSARSIFRQWLVDALLSGDGDADQDGYVTGRLGKYLQTSVRVQSRGAQNVQIGRLHNSGHPSGKFAFAVREGARSETLPTPERP